MIFDKMAEMQSAYERLEMQSDLLMAVIERTGNFREGFYAMRLLTDLSKLMNRPQVIEGAGSPEEAMDLLIQHLNNMSATVQTQIERIDV